jgi:hypothetical protein
MEKDITYIDLYGEYNMTLDENLQENQQYGHLMILSLLRKFETGLPVNIWVDPGQTYKIIGQSKQIKFQLDNADHPNYYKMITMTISDNPEIIDNLDKIKLSENEIKLIKQFIILNLDILLRLGDNIGIVEFVKKMKRIE